MNFNLIQNGYGFTKGYIPWNKGGDKIVKNCLICNKEFEVFYYRKNAKYCSSVCNGRSGKGRKRTLEAIENISRAKQGKNNPMFGKKGEQSVNWKGGLTHPKCKICNKTKSRGARFCSVCFNLQEGTINRLRELNRKQWESKEPTSIEKKVYKELKVRGLLFETQKLINGKFLVDAYIPSLNLIIEADGEYWHSLPKTINRDKSKNAYLKACGYNLLRLSETEINNGSFKERIKN